MNIRNELITRAIVGWIVAGLVSFLVFRHNQGKEISREKSVEQYIPEAERAVMIGEFMDSWILKILPHSCTFERKESTRTTKKDIKAYDVEVISTKAQYSLVHYKTKEPFKESYVFSSIKGFLHHLPTYSSSIDNHSKEFSSNTLICNISGDLSDSILSASMWELRKERLNKLLVSVRSSSDETTRYASENIHAVEGFLAFQLFNLKEGEVLTYISDDQKLVDVITTIANKELLRQKKKVIYQTIPHGDGAFRKYTIHSLK